MEDSDRIRRAIERIERWMNEHGAPLLAENLAPSASQAALAEIEAGLGAPLPAQLRALWSLHDGQREEQNGFVEALDLLGARQSLGEQETVLLLLEFLREHPGDWEEAGATGEEVTSDEWFPFAARDSDSLVVNGRTGRVFSCGKDAPPLRLLAGSLAEWWEGYADRVEGGDYEVEEGFGDYYLQLRDREAERRQAMYDEEERRKRETPLAIRFREALTQRRDDRCLEVLEDALAAGDRHAFEEAIEQLFSGEEPEFIAATLRPFLRLVTLAPDRWIDVAVGGALLDNNAIRDLAVSKAAGASAGRLERLAATARWSIGRKRRVLRELLEKLRDA